jgi:hypothetical protein
MNRLLVVGVTWGETPQHPPLVEGVFGLFGDWIRLSPGMWLLYSGHPERAIADRVRQVLSPTDYVIALETNPRGLWGSQPYWVWAWIEQRLTGNPPGSFAVPPPPPPQGSLPSK